MSRVVAVCSYHHCIVRLVTAKGWKQSECTKIGNWPNKVGVYKTESTA